MWFPTVQQDVAFILNVCDFVFLFVQRISNLSNTSTSLGYSFDLQLYSAIKWLVLHRLSLPFMKCTSDLNSSMAWTWLCGFPAQNPAQSLQNAEVSLLNNSCLINHVGKYLAAVEGLQLLGSDMSVRLLELCCER